MSFGFGVGDIASAIQLAWTVYKSCKDAPESFEHLSNDVNSLHATLKIANEELSPEKFPKERSEGLKTILHGCNAVLVDIQKLLERYESLKTQSKRMWDRWGFGSKDVEGLRSRLTAQMSILSVFINTHSLPHLERKLSRLAAEYRGGKYEGSTISRQTIESLNQSDQRVWRDIRRDLESVGITVACLEANRNFVIDWFAEAVACGKLDEQPPTNLSNDSPKETEHFEQLKASSTNNSSRLNPKSEKAKKPPSGIEKQSNDNTHVEEVKKGEPEKVRLNSTTPENALTHSTWYGKAWSGDEIEDAWTASSDELNVPFSSDEIAASTELNATEASHRSKSRHSISKIAAVDNKTLSPEEVLISAAQNCDVRKVRAILNDEEAMIWVSVMALTTALDEAVISNNVEITKLLLEQGAPIESIEHGGYYPLTKAALQGCTETAQLLLDKGADINATDYFGETALTVAALRNHLKFGQLLLRRGADPNVESLFGGIPLVNAAKHYWTEPFLESLLRSGAYIDAKDNLGGTALMQAAEYARFDNMRTLLMHGANVNERDENGVTALGILMNNLERNSNDPAIIMLREYGAEE